MSVDNFDVLFAKSLSKGGGGSGTDNYDELSNKPQINGNALTGNKTGANLGLQDAITSESKLSSDLVDDTGAENLFVSSTEKSTWGGKQDPATTLSGYGITDAFTKTETGTQITNAIGALDVSSVGGSGKYISAISETDGKISATAETMDTTPTSGSEKAVTSGAVYTALGSKQDALTTAQLAAANSGITAAKLAADEAALSGKQDALTTAQLAAANSGITAAKLAADETALGEVINGGAAGTKNDLMLQISEMKIYNGAAQGASWSENVCTVAGITFAVNADFTITVSGTLSGSVATFRLFRQRENIWGGEFLSGCPTGGGTSTYRMFVQRERSPMTDVASDTGAGSIVGTDTTSNVYAAIQVKTSIQSPVTFKPMICRKTLYDVNPDYEPYAPAKTNVEITPALVEVVDNGAKNCAAVNNATYTNVPRYIVIDSICDKNCVLSLDSITSTDENADTCALMFKFEDDTLSSTIIQLPRGTRYEGEFSFDKNVKSLQIYASNIYNNSGTTNTVTITNLMLCTKTAWDISHKFVPHCPSMAEMYEMIQALQNGTRSAPALAKAEPEEVRTETDEEPESRGDER